MQLVSNNVLVNFLRRYRHDYSTVFSGTHLFMCKVNISQWALYLTKYRICRNLFAKCQNVNCLHHHHSLEFIDRVVMKYNTNTSFVTINVTNICMWINSLSAARNPKEAFSMQVAFYFKALCLPSPSKSMLHSSSHRRPKNKAVGCWCLCKVQTCSTHHKKTDQSDVFHCRFWSPRPFSNLCFFF